MEKKRLVPGNFSSVSDAELITSTMGAAQETEAEDQSEAVYETGSTAVQFKGKPKAANRDNGVLQEMVNAEVAENRSEQWKSE